MRREPRDFERPRTSEAGAADGDDEVSPVIELLVAGRRRLLRSRPAVVAVGLLARLGRPRALALWPTLDRPLFAVDLSARRPAAWLRATFEPSAGGPGPSLRGRLRARMDAATWSALRARGLVLGEPGGIAIAAAETALGRPLERPRIAFYSPSGAPTGKASVFVFDGRDPQPAVLARAMTLGALDHRLRREVEAIEAIRGLTAAVAEVNEALPLAPLWAGEVGGRYVVALSVDPLSTHTGAVDRDAALRWLRAFQAATAAADTTALDHERELAVLEEAWSILRPERAGAARAWLAAELDRLGDVRFPPCGVHGDYWRGNIAASGAALRVYDWEWWRERDHPLFDLWTYELAELRGFAESDRGGLDRALAACIERVEAEVRARELPGETARALLLPVLAELAIRGRRVSGKPSPPEIPYAQLMAAAERLLAIG